MTDNSEIRLETEEGEAPETVKPASGEESELEVLESLVNRTRRTGTRSARGGAF